MDKKRDYDSRDYEFDEIEPDERFEICKIEYIITVIVFFVYMAIGLVITFTMGTKAPGAYGYVIGLPMWIFLIVLLTVVMIGVIFFLLDRVFVDMDLDDEADRKKEGK